MSQLEADFSASPVTTSPQNSFGQNNLTPNSSQSPSDLGPSAPKRPTAPAINSADGPGVPGLHSRSCVTCRKRKVKCDKRHPCSNCNKAAIECVFPGPGRAPRRSRKAPDTELLARLRRLEGVVQSLGKGDDENDETVIEPVNVKNAKPQATQTNEAEGVEPRKTCGIVGAHDVHPAWPPETRKGHKGTDSMVKEFGRLVVDEGRSRYVSNKFWNSLSEEVAEMQDILDDPTDEEDDYPSPGSGSSASANHQGFIFSFSSTILSLRNFHPREEQIPTYWNIYKTNVDPVIKLFHIPFHENMISQASQDLDHISKPLEVFVFTIYYAAITSLSAEDCIRHLGLERQAALRKYRFAVEQALARAGFLSTQDFVVLQSMLLFLTCVRRSDDTRYVWTLTGLLIRLAQAQGCHRDGHQFDLSPFDTEMRRRLWWQICTLDVRASEDHGCDPSIIEQSFDTKFPLNINDEDISPTMKDPPEEHEGATEMTFDLIRYSVSTTVRRLSYAPPGPGPCRTRNAGLSLEDKEHMIEDLHQYLEKKYLRHCDTTIPLRWVAATVARLIMAKMWLIVHHPFSRSDRGAGLPQQTRDRLFLTSIEVIEFSRLLETEKTTLKWGWLFRTYVQWHALAFVLSQLCIRTTGSEVDKAWRVIEGVFDDWGGTVLSNQRGMLWKPLRKLMVKARTERSKGLQKQAMFPLDGSLGPTAWSLAITPGPMSTVNGFNDFPTFDTSAPYNVDYPGIMTPESTGSNGLSGLQPPVAEVEQSQTNGVRNMNGAKDENQFLLDLNVFAQERPIMDEDMSWTGWDDMTKDFTMDGYDGQGNQGGPRQDGMFNWL